jgi:probable poly-beta-1,6-N-acetyl-D-glucosamine export protein
VNKTAKRKSLDEIQLARAFAIFAVLIVHTSSSGVTALPQNTSLFPTYNFLNIAGKLGTPTFIMLSSFVLFYNYFPRQITTSLITKFYQKRIKFILIPYILFSIIYFVIKWYFYYDYPTLTAAFSKFIYLTSLGKAHPHLYFVFISVQLYILFPMLLIVFKRFTFMRKNAIWIGLLIQWVWVILNKNYFGITIKGSISLSYMSFYFVGAYLGIYYDEIRVKMKNRIYKDKILLPIFIAYGALVILYTGYMYLVRINVYEKVAEHLPDLVNSYLGEFTWATHALLAGLVLFYLSHLANEKFSVNTKTFFMEVGATSFGIYLIHPMILMVLRVLLPTGTPLVYTAWQIAGFFIMFFISWAIVRFTFNYIPHYWIIFGKLPERQKFRKSVQN